ncbi:MAG: diguanylate cyclase, partial [Proteobacteria bacterium]|nr:diguanylate cyclase [Pseudomonadota bacterium]
DRLISAVINSPAWLSRIGTVKGLGFVLLTASLLYFLLRTPYGPGRDRQATASFIHGQRFILLAFFGLALGAPLLGYGIYRLHGPQIEREAYANLAAIARLKAEEIENWLVERQGDTMLLATDHDFARQLEQFAGNEKDDALRARILSRLAPLQPAYGYDGIMVLDINGRLLASLGGHGSVSAELQNRLRLALASNQVQRSEIHRDESGTVQLDWVVPMLVPDGQGERAVAAIMLRAAPERFLFPLIQTWPTASRSAESLLVRRDGESIVFLNALRHRNDAALSLRFPLDDIDLPSAIAVRAGAPGTVQGTDYRGVQVLSAYRPVKGTTWHLVAKIDREEVLAPVGALVLWVSLIAFFAVALVSVALFMLWRQRQRAHQWELMAQTAAAIADSEARQRAILDNAPAIIFMKDTAGCYLLTNRRFEAVQDISEEELQGRTDHDIFPPDLADCFAANDSAVIQSGQPIEFEESVPHRDGLHTYLSVKFPLRRRSGEIYAICGIASDITERKLAEAKIQRLTRFYAALTQCTQAIVRCTSERELFPQICRNAVEYGGMKMAWIGLIDTSTQRLHPVACSGEGTEYLEGIQISVDELSPLGRGPAGSAVRENRPIWCQDFLSDPLTAPWHESGAHFGWRAVAALPLHRHGLAVGAFVLYAHEMNAFDEGVRDLLVQMAADISLVLDRLALEQERERAEQRLRDSEAFNLSVLDSLIANIAVLDEHGVILSVNRSWRRFAELNDAPELIRSSVGLNYLEVCSDAPNVKAGIEAVLSGAEDDFGLEYPCHSPTEQRWFYMHVSPLQGSVKGVVVAHENITERKLAVHALQESEALFHTLAMTAPVGIFRTDAVGNCVFVNQRWSDFAGIGADEARDHGWAMTVAEEDRARATEAWEASTRERRPFRLEFRFRRPDGALVWVIGQAEPERDDSGQVRGYVGTITDITTIKLGEERLRQAAVVFENAHEGIMVTDAEERILMVNRAFSEMTGYASEEVLGQTPRVLKSGRHDREFFASLWQKLAFAGQWQGEIWNRRKDGEVFPELLSISAVMDDAGQVTQYVGIFADISQIKDATAKLEHLAHHDALTGLPNRLLLFARLEHSLDMALREHKQLALLMLDLDRFKDVNDSFGHLAGDELLQQVATRLTHRLRGIDTITRLGGDEFAILLEDLSHPQDAAQVAYEIIEALNEPWRLSNNAEVRIGTSVGISLFPEHGQTSQELLQHADAALYRAKEEGRSSFKYFSDDLTRAARRRINMESLLRRAIKQDELQVRYQPQIEIASGRIVGAEALVRWQSPEEGLIDPVRFIPVAEETGLIAAIGEWVLRETCRQGRQWLDEGLPPLNLAVNLSPHQFRYGDINSTVAAVLAETGFPARHLELELTESALMEREAEAVKTLRNLRDLGVHLAIDDFGTGYSSLAYLKRFPLDVLKIDKSFIDDIPHHQDD